MENKQRRLIDIKRSALEQKEIDLNDPVPIGVKQMLASILCEKQEAFVYRTLRLANRKVRKVIANKIPWTLRRLYHDFPQAFRHDASFPLRFTDEDGKEHLTILYPDVPFYFTPEEMRNIVLKLKTDEDPEKRQAYELLIVYLNRLRRARQDLRIRQLHVATYLNTPEFNTYKGLLKANPEYFVIIYKALTGFDLLEKYKL